MYVQEIYLVDADVRNYLCAEKFLEIHQGISLLLNEKQVNFSSHRFPKRSGHNMDILFHSERCIRVTAVCLWIRLYESNDLYEAANPCTLAAGSPVLEQKYLYSVQIFLDQGPS